MTLILKIANQSFRIALQLMMMHHNTKYGYTMFGGLEHILRISIDNLTLRYNLELDAIIQLFNKTYQLMMMYQQTKFGYQRSSSADDIVESHILIGAFTVN